MLGADSHDEMDLISVKNWKISVNEAKLRSQEDGNVREDCWS